MIYRSKGQIKTSHEGLMIGNGTLGALIYGTDNLILSLDKIDLWDNRLPKEYRDKDFDYEHLLEVLRDGKYKEDNIFDRSYLHPYPTKINCAMLVFNRAVGENDLFSLNLDDATFTVSGGDLDFFGFIDANKDVMVYRYDSELTYEIKMVDYLTKKVSKGGLGYKPFETLEDGKIKHIRQKMYGKHCFGILLHESMFGTKKQLLITVYQDDGYESAKKRLLDYFGKEDENLKAHKEWWRSYCATANITTCDDKINELFQFGRYYFGCNSRKKYPMTLHGVWTRNNGELPPWKADLHNDINVEMTYEGYLKLGNYEEGKVLVDWMVDHKKTFRKFAKKFMKTDGLLVPADCTQEGVELCGWPQYALNPCCSIWVLKAFYDYYCYTKDTSFLKEEAFPFFTETEKCIFSIMEKNENGHYQLKVLHASPEYFENGPKSVHPYQTNFELTMIRYLYERLSEMGRILKKDVSHYDEVLSELSPYYRDENGLLVISKDQKFDMSHRHFSHMLMYKNMELVDPFLNRDLIQKDISHLERFGPENWVGFSPVECSGMNSYIGNGEMALKHLKDYECFTHPNGFHMNTDYKRTGYTEFGPYVLTLEANIGYLKALADMMIQNYEDKLVVFPSVAESLKQGGVHFDNLRTFGDHKVSGSFKDGKESFQIQLKRPDTIKLLNNFSNNPVLKVDGRDVAFAVKRGEFIVIHATKTIAYEG
ncbi:MAG: glycoside hydrolase family 95 protein [Bacilli bacterium]|nr:glycoside hydrolase family 95 protein [Bacilli bacterium]